MYVEIFGEVYDLGAILKNAVITLGVMAFLAAPLVLVGCSIWLLW